MRFGGLAWLAHRGSCTQGCAHTHRVRRQVAKSSRERQMAGYAREELFFAAHAACGNAERRRRGLHHTRAAAAERCFAQERRALAIAHGSRIISHHERGSSGWAQFLLVRGETYHISVSEPLAASAGARADAPAAPSMLPLRFTCTRRVQAVNSERLYTIVDKSSSAYLRQRACDTSL